MASVFPAPRDFILTVFLGFWGWQISAQLSVVPVPKTPAIGDNVLLSVSVTGSIRTFSWHRGRNTDNRVMHYIPTANFSLKTGSIQNFNWHRWRNKDNLILLYFPQNVPSEVIYPPYVGRVRGFPNGSMEILGLTTSDSGSYTVVIQTNIVQEATVVITVSAVVTGMPIIFPSSRPTPPDWTSKIIGSVIGAILGAAILITTAVFLYKRCGNCRSRKYGVKENMHDVPDISRVPPPLYQNIVSQKPGGVPIYTLKPVAPDSDYTDL
ncbi:uncharacterized protein LOC115076149 isoform X2 [Rhinatrema bivittatum]|nr:uncharacterized protein LOC115076149 isoform X2 [Rhinatrema bivittatum]